jgi:DegV family protein with EDD domain
MEWNVIADSSCDLCEWKPENEKIRFTCVPFAIQVEEEHFVDDATLDVDAMMAAMEQSREGSRTACPSPQMWLEQFQKPGCVIAVTVSSELSGSYNSACVARNMLLEQEPDRQIAVVDSRSAGSELVLLIRRLCCLIEVGYDFDTVVDTIRQFVRQTHVIFAFSSFENLVKNGRIGIVSGYLAGKLGFWGIGTGSPEGKIQVKRKVRGSKKAFDTIVKEMREHGLAQSSVVISHCQNAEFAVKLKETIQEQWQDVDVTILPTRGLCSYYAEKGGVIIGY